MSLDAAWALDWARRAAELIAENRAELTELDLSLIHISEPTRPY